MLSRRDLVGKLAACSAAVFAAGVARSSSASTHLNTATSADAVGTDLALAVDSAVAEETAGIDAAGQSTATIPPVSQQEPPPWQLLHPLTVGSVVANGWKVADLSPVTDGACVLTLQNGRGRSQRVHLCRNGGRPQGLVYTERFDLLVMNGGQGDLPTEEGFAQTVAEVAHALAANEPRNRQHPLMTALLPHTERLERFSGVEDWRLR